MRAECRLLEESRYEAMILHIVNVFLLESTFAISLSDVYFGFYLFAQIFLFGHRALGCFFARSVDGCLPIRANCLFWMFRLLIIILLLLLSLLLLMVILWWRGCWLLLFTLVSLKFSRSEFDILLHDCQLTFSHALSFRCQPNVFLLFCFAFATPLWRWTIC